MKYSDLTAEQRIARNRQNAKSRNAYEAKAYDKITLRIRKDGGDGFTIDQLRAAANGESLNGWIIDAIRDKI